MTWPGDAPRAAGFPVVRLARYAMRCRFEVALPGANAGFLRAAGEAALDEVERLHAQLSAFELSSEVSSLNARAGAGPVRVSPRLFDLLRQCRDFTRRTRGAFDVTVGPLLRCWGFRGEERSLPPPGETVREALAAVGAEHLLLDEDALTVRFARPGMSLDLGGVGKGYAVQAAAEALREAGVTSALVHAGTSSVYALGAPPGSAAWRVAVGFEECSPGSNAPVISLRDEALSVSSWGGRVLCLGGRVYGHVLDPRAGCPAARARAAAVTHGDGAAAEALSTALVVGGEALWREIQAEWPGSRVVILPDDPEGAPAPGAHA